MDPYNHPDSTSPGFDNQAFDSFPEINYPPSPHIPGTPSYNGSYQNSPYSAPSELDFGDFKQSDSLGLFSHSADLDYDPAQYDAPSAGNSLLMFNNNFMTGGDNNLVSVSITPAEDMTSPSSAVYDHSSPGSSNGGGESENDYRHHSPASSISSHPRRNNASPHIPLNDLHVTSPYMSGGQLPADRTSSPNLSKPPSPPQLVIPESVGQQPTQTPIINAPSGDGGLSGPQLHIVPATPVVGGDDGSQSVAYNNNNYIQQGVSLFLSRLAAGRTKRVAVAWYATSLRTFPWDLPSGRSVQFSRWGSVRTERHRSSPLRCYCDNASTIYGQVKRPC